MVWLGHLVRVSALWRVGDAGGNGQHAPAAISNFCPSAIHTRRDPLDSGGFARVITGSYKYRLGDAFGLRAITRVIIVCRRDRGDVFVRSGRTDLLLPQALGQSVTFRGGRKEERVMKTVKECATCFRTKHVGINGQIPGVVI